MLSANEMQGGKMYRKLILVAALFVTAALACNTPGSSAPTQGLPAQEASPQVIVVTATPPAATSGPVVRPTASALPATVPPSFSHSIIFAETPDISNQLREFHGGVTRIYALWQYFDMTDGLVVRRDWYREGALWITKTEPWSLAKYGANGTVTDVSIYDTQNGLPSGHYELQLFISDVPQFTPNDDNSLRSFDIAPPGDGGS
jgi:hypothetical protein